jgi:hypothetical protein
VSDDSLTDVVCCRSSRCVECEASVAVAVFGVLIAEIVLPFYRRHNVGKLWAVLLRPGTACGLARKGADWRMEALD